MNITVSMRRRHCWSMALKTSMLPPRAGQPAPSPGFATGNIIDAQQAYDLAKAAKLADSDVVYTTWNPKFSFLPTDYTLALLRRREVKIVHGLVPWKADDGRRVMLVDPQEPHAYTIDRAGRIRRIRGPKIDLDHGTDLAIDHLCKLAACLEDEIRASDLDTDTPGEGWS